MGAYWLTLVLAGLLHGSVLVFLAPMLYHPKVVDGKIESGSLLLTVEGEKKVCVAHPSKDKKVARRGVV